jgi:hypothetical protein
MDTLNLLARETAPPPMLAPTTRKTVEYRTRRPHSALRIASADAAATTAAAAFDPSLRWCLLEYRIDDDAIGRELSRYVSLSAPKAIGEARRAFADANAVHLDDVGTLELESTMPSNAGRQRAGKNFKLYVSS